MNIAQQEDYNSNNAPFFFSIKSSSNTLDVPSNNRMVKKSINLDVEIFRLCNIFFFKKKGIHNQSGFFLL